MSLTDMVIMPGADYQAACDAIREKTEGVGYIRSGDMAELIRSIEIGVQLPVLTNPASAEDIASGKEAIDGEGKLMTGTAASGGVPVKSGRVDLSAAATTFTIPDVGAEYNKIALYSLYWDQPFTYDDVFNGNDAIITLSNALSKDGAVALLGSKLGVNPNANGQFKISSIGNRPYLHFTFNANGSVTVGAYLDWTEFRAGAYLWVAWAE